MSGTKTMLRSLRAVFPRERRDKYVMFRATTAEKSSINKAATALGITMSRYLLELHRRAIGTDSRA
jgi:hypothetical protein